VILLSVIRGYGLFTTIRNLNPTVPGGSEKFFSDTYLNTLRQGSLADKIALFVLEGGEMGMSLRALTGILNAADDEIDLIAGKLKKSGILCQDDGVCLYHRDLVHPLKEKISIIVHQYHQHNPLRAGINKEELFIRTGTKAEFFHLVLLLMIQEGTLLNDRDLIRERRFNPEGTFADPILLKVEKLFLAYGLQPATPAEAAKALNIDLKTLLEALNALIRSERLLRINENFYLHPQSWCLLRELLAQYFEKNDILTPQDLRGLCGLSRKFSIPLLEFLDYRKLTIRTDGGRKLWKEGAM
jgi:selenocysteine-specific elongation factor